VHSLTSHRHVPPSVDGAGLAERREGFKQVGELVGLGALEHPGDLRCRGRPPELRQLARTARACSTSVLGHAAGVAPPTAIAAGFAPPFVFLFLVPSAFSSNPNPTWLRLDGLWNSARIQRKTPRFPTLPGGVQLDRPQEDVIVGWVQ
jgi:hypothetical protein